MKKFDLIGMARRNLWRRKLRTILTVLGVLIGTTSIVVMLSLGIGLNVSQRKMMESWGSLTTIRIMQGMVFDDEGNPQGQSKSLNDDAVAEIRGIEGVLAVCPAYELYGDVRLGRKSGGLSLIGIEPELMGQLEFAPSHGRLLEKGDRNAVVVGSKVIEGLFDEAERRQMERGTFDFESGEEKDPGEMMNQRLALTVENMGGKRKTYNFMVVGVLAGDDIEYSYQALAPIEEVKRIRHFSLTGQSGGGGAFSPNVMDLGGAKAGRGRREDQTNDYSYILVKTAGVEHTPAVSQQIKDLGYDSWSVADALEGIEKSSRTVQAVLGGIGAVTLLVAALGITNTMIMSIYERTKEIGIMKVIGATFSDIYLLFLVEAGLIGFVGGLFGIGFSYGISKIINYFTGSFFGMFWGDESMGISLIPPWLALFALLFAVLVGLLAGLYPAYRAVRLSPISAIRNE